MADNSVESQEVPKRARSFKESQGRFARDPEAAKACAILGGKARGAQITRRKKLSEAAKDLLAISLDASDDATLQAASNVLNALGIENPTGADALMLAQFTKACKGDTEAARYVRDTAGERPSDQVHLIASERPIDVDSVQSMTDEELALLAESRDTDVAPIGLPEGENPVVSTVS